MIIMLENMWPKLSALIPCLLVNEVSMVEVNVTNVYKEEWYDSVSVYEIDSAFVVKEMIDVRDGWVKCEIFD